MKSNPITWAFIQAVIEVESGGDPNAESSSGAKGLMQLMDATGEEIFLEVGIGDCYNPFDPYQNILLGSHYLQKLVDKYGGDLELALTAYHSGMGTVDRLLKQMKATTLEEILPELGPVGQLYAKKVLDTLWKQQKKG